MSGLLPKIYFCGEDRTWVRPKDTPAGGNTYGYRNGYRIMGKCLEAVGFESSPDADIYLHYTPPHCFIPEKGKVNILYSMWEAEDMPELILNAFQAADFCVVPSFMTKNAIRKGGVLTTTYICRHAVETDVFKFQDREGYRLLGGGIRILFVGAPTMRKGSDLAARAFYNAFHGTGAKVELYMKSSFFEREGKLTPMPEYDTIVDTRNLPIEQLLDLYGSSHAFLFPSRGEGAGLPPLEAMATGLPVIAPAYGAMSEYMFPEISFPVRWKPCAVEYGVLTFVCQALSSDLVKSLKYIYNHLDEALERGKKASEFVRKEFSIPRMGARMREIILDIKGKTENGTFTRKT